MSDTAVKRATSMAVRRALEACGLESAVVAVSTTESHVREDEWRTTVEIVGQRIDKMATALRVAGFDARRNGDQHITVFTPRNAEPLGSTAIERADATNGTVDLHARIDAAELLKPANKRKLRTLHAVADRTAQSRLGIVGARSTTFPASSARALVRMDLLTEHTIPHRGFKLTDRGRRALGEVLGTRPSTR